MHPRAPRGPAGETAGSRRAGERSRAKGREAGAETGNLGCRCRKTWHKKKAALDLAVRREAEVKGQEEKGGRERRGQGRTAEGRAGERVRARSHLNATLESGETRAAPWVR